MNKVILITTRNYPFQNISDYFEIVNGVDIYMDCIKSLNLPIENKDDDMKIQKERISKLYKDQKAEWTNPGIFNKYLTSGIPLLKKSFGNATIYILPCTGEQYIGKDYSSLRQKYTSNCIDVICKVETLQREEIYAIIHSLDTGVKRIDSSSGIIMQGEISADSSLKDIADKGHLCLFHHSSGDSIYDNIVSTLCNGNGVNMDTLIDLFPNKTDNVGWWDKLSKYNNNEQYEY